MKRILHLVSHGYQYFTAGEVPTKKIESVFYKFQDRYQTDRSSQQRWRSKQKNISNCELVLLAGDPCQFWLLATKGEGLVFDLEQMKDTTSKRSRIEISGYELVKTPRANRPAAWTWRMTEDTFQGWRERIKTAVRHKNTDLMAQSVYSLKRVPGFNQSRAQAYALHKLMLAEWKRHGSGEPPFDQKIFVSFVGKHQTAEQIEVKKLLSQVKNSRSKAL
jgi:hypothetical protein